MVKKILLDGSPCPKCAQAEAILRKRDVWEKLDSIVIAEEGRPESEGMLLAAQYAIKLAPFFIVEADNGEVRTYTRVFEFIKKELETDSAEGIDVGPAGAAELKPRHISQADSSSLKDLAEKYSSMEAGAILGDMQKRFGNKLVLAFSGAEDVVLIHLAMTNALPFGIFCLDTGRLHEETCAYLDTVRNHYGISMEIFSPDPALLQPFLEKKGMNSFYSEGHGECCGIRKVEPLGRALKNRRAWATGLRRDQSPATRSNLQHVESDNAHLNSEGIPLFKVNPLLDWSSDDIWAYIRENDIPYNPLHDSGYKSIGCQPCTRPSRPGEHERAARWWWEDSTRRECGLHIK